MNTPKPRQSRANRGAKSPPRRRKGTELSSTENPEGLRPGSPNRKAAGGNEKLHKVIASAGVTSRRGAEQLIIDGRVKVNGQLATLGQRVAASDRIEVNGTRLSTEVSTKHRLIMYHKPVGELSSRSDPQERPLVFDALPKIRGRRWISVGRLDLNTSGLLLFTTDGELANRLMHPANEIAREYLVRVLGDVSEANLETLRSGVILDDGPAQFDSVQPIGGEGANRWYRVVVRQGKNRLVRRLWESLGFTVSRLKRSAYGPISLPRGLPPGKWSDVEPGLAEKLFAAVNLAVSVESTASRGVVKHDLDKTDRAYEKPARRTDSGGRSRQRNQQRKQQRPGSRSGGRHQRNRSPRQRGD